MLLRTLVHIVSLILRAILFFIRTKSYEWQDQAQHLFFTIVQKEKWLFWKPKKVLQQNSWQKFDDHNSLWKLLKRKKRSWNLFLCFSFCKFSLKVWSFRKLKKREQLEFSEVWVCLWCTSWDASLPNFGLKFVLRFVVNEN